MKQGFSVLLAATLCVALGSAADLLRGRNVPKPRQRAPKPKRNASGRQAICDSRTRALCGETSSEIA